MILNSLLGTFATISKERNKDSGNGGDIMNNYESFPVLH